jgi:uncharacterized protein (DUF433 family)
MPTEIATLIQPLRVDEDGAIRVGRTRVTLDLVVEAFEAGRSAEEIVLEFPALTLGEAYAAVSYYLNNREWVEAYLAEGMRKSEGELALIEAMPGNREIRERLLALRNCRESA